MNSTVRKLMMVGLLAAATSSAAIGQSKDPVMGTWVLNVAKSKYEVGETRSQTRTYTPAPNGYKFTADAVSAFGASGHSEFTAVVDGKYHALVGSAVADSIMVRRIDAYTVETIQKMGSTVVTRGTRVISKDGKTLTNTTRGNTPTGKPYTNVEVFEKK